MTEKAMWRDPALVVARELEDDHRDPAGLPKHAQRCRGDGHDIRLIGMSGFGSSPVRKSATNEAHSSGCGSPVDDWNANQVAALQDRYAGLVAIHRLFREAAPAVLHDVNGQAFARLGVERACALPHPPRRLRRLQERQPRPERPRALSRPVAPRRWSRVDCREESRSSRAVVRRWSSCSPGSAQRYATSAAATGCVFALSGSGTAAPRS
jgi:hypothetical protein